jgi:hydroxypyruvate reductase/glycerate 2-kinase
MREEESPHQRLRDHALSIWRAGVAAVAPYGLVREAINRVPLPETGRIGIVGAGKAGAAMARAVEDALGPALDRASGLVIVPDATVVPLRRVTLWGARSRPDNRPTEAGVEGSRRVLALAKSLGEDDLLLCLFSGGGSALLPLPAEGVTLAEKVRITSLLQERGVPIEGMNAVRKHLSAIKGGRLAAATRARVVSLLLSDVEGDRLDVIASGPTAPDPTTYTGALAVLDRHGLRGKTPRPVLDHLERGAAGGLPETPKSLSDRVANLVVGNNRTAREGAAAAARGLGYRVVDHGEFHGDAGDFPTWFRERLAGLPRDEPVCAISGGEITVRLPERHGRGGRNQHSALAVLAAMGAEGLKGRCLLFAGTDGEDGPTDAAGAFADEAIAREAARRGLDPADHLRSHDSYRFFDPLGGLLRTGLTGTNVMDLRVALLSPCR